MKQEKSIDPDVITREEARRRFLKTVKSIADYWAHESRAATAKEKCDGVAFSILVLLDGGNCGNPAYTVIPTPNKDDKSYCVERGLDFYEDVPDSVTATDIGQGCLHEEFQTFK